MTPKAGRWPTIQQLVQPLLDDPDHDQITTFYVWASASLRSLMARL